MIATIHAVHEGRAPTQGSLFARIHDLMTKQSPETDGRLPLTAREAQVLRHIALGLSNREIGLSLGISVETVKEHVQNILRKIDATDRTQAAVWAVRNQLVLSRRLEHRGDAAHRRRSLGRPADRGWAF